MAENWTQDQLERFVDEQWEDDAPEVLRQMSVWLARGDGVAVYRNADLGHPQVGMPKIVSYGSPYAQLEVDTVHIDPEQDPERFRRTVGAWRGRGYKTEPVPRDGAEHPLDVVCPVCSVPPVRLPDIGGAINWRFQLEAIVRSWGGDDSERREEEGQGQDEGSQGRGSADPRGDLCDAPQERRSRS